MNFRPLTDADIPMLHEWLSRPHVAQWWGPASSLNELQEDYGDAAHATGPVSAFIAMEDEQPIGFIQAYSPVESHAEGWWLDEHDAGVRGIDQFLADGDRLGQGLGTAMVREFVDRLFAVPEVTRVQTDPAPDNARAIRCYEKAGFRATREVTTPDGRALLMYREREVAEQPGAVRRLSPRDAMTAVPALADLLRDCVAGGASVGFMHPLDRERAERFWRTVADGVSRGDRVLLAAESSDGALVGTVQLVLSTPENQAHRADVAKMLVHRRARRRGVARRLLDAVEDEARAHGRTLLVLDTVSGSDAERLYRGAGWQRVGEIPGYALMPDGAPCPTTIFYKSIAP